MDVRGYYLSLLLLLDHLMQIFDSETVVKEKHGVWAILNDPFAEFKQFTASICPFFCVLNSLWQYFLIIRNYVTNCSRLFGT